MIEAVNFASEAPALYAETSERAISYRDLSRRVIAMRELLHRLPKPALVFQFAGAGPAAVASYLACLAEGLPLGLGEPSRMARFRVIAAYQPTAVLLEEDDTEVPQDYELAASAQEGGLALWTKADDSPYVVAPHRALALLLRVSGSMGECRFARLSRGNLLSAACAIEQHLGLFEGETAIQSLPLHRSHGLSILNSHLLAGASVAFTAHTCADPEFWRVVDRCGCTSFAGLPQTYETLHRLGVSPSDRKTIRTMVQAGGHLEAELQLHFHKAGAKKGCRFAVTYGRAEASGRMAYLPPERLEDKAGSIGIGIPRGELWLEGVDGDEDLRQLHYRGPNVMLGYATGPADLTRGDEQKGMLATGDLGERDRDGFYKVTGRLARYARLLGRRVNLATVETEVERCFSVRAAAMDEGDRLRIYLEGGYGTTPRLIREHVAGLLGVPSMTIGTESLTCLPTTPSGRKDYGALA